MGNIGVNIDRQRLIIIYLIKSIYRGEKYMTEKQLADLLQELEKLTALRLSISERISRAREIGDLISNKEYQDAKREQEANEARVSEIRDLIRNVIS